ncbi:MAG: histidine--tRNA ligase, partial [Methanobacteriota archaeon]
GRYRQFWQFGAELIGADTALADAEVIALGTNLLASAGIRFETQVGHLAPMKHLLGAVEATNQRRVMACLDKRDFEGTKVCLAEMGRDDLVDALVALASCRSAAEAFEITGDIPERSRIEQLFDLLDANGCKYTPNFGIARGLDYYTGMVFECFAENLGAENQILGGGAYRLAHLFGGDDVPSCGFAIGFDRVLVAAGEIPLPREPVVALASVGAGRRAALAVANAFRDAGIRVELELAEKGIGQQLAHAAKVADFAVMLGDRECETGTVTLKNLHSGEQRTLSCQAAIAEVKACGTC